MQTASTAAQTFSLPTPSALAEHFALDPGVVFLNHGSFGACPRVILDRQAELRARMEREPIRYFVEDLEGLMDSAREALGALLGGDAAGLVRVSNATAGVNTVLRSLRFSPGDELLTNTHEYNACNNALRFAAERDGARVVEAAVPWPLRGGDDEVVAAIERAVTARTKLALVSHVTSATGVVFPIERIVKSLQGRGVDVLVDGAHAPGMTPVRLDEMSPAYYAGNCHKWLCAPKGTGFLWVRADRRERIRPLVISHGANSVRTDRPRFRLEFDYCGTDDVTGWLVLPELIRFMDGLLPGGWPEVVFRNREQALRGREILARELGVALPAPDHMIGALATVPIADRTEAEAQTPTKYHDALQDRLIAKWGVQAPVVVFPAGSNRRWVRIAMQVYNTLGQVEYLARALREECGRG
jgi:isopenicillin-N epimerase